YEASWYGPLNMLLTTYFPASKGFNVKPQARLRQPSADPRERTSIDSYGQTVGTYDDDSNPDFLVSIGTSSLHADTPLLIYEVKREGMDEGEATLQLDRYIEWAKQYQRQ
ncbi:hypothetical protein K439DRAFT_1285173, partial [Ramaria rubella]